MQIPEIKISEIKIPTGMKASFYIPNRKPMPRSTLGFMDSGVNIVSRVRMMALTKICLSLDTTILTLNTSESLSKNGPVRHYNIIVNIVRKF